MRKLLQAFVQDGNGLRFYLLAYLCARETAIDSSIVKHLDVFVIDALELLGFDGRDVLQ